MREKKTLYIGLMRSPRRFFLLSLCLHLFLALSALFPLCRERPPAQPQPLFVDLPAPALAGPAAKESGPRPVNPAAPGHKAPIGPSRRPPSLPLSALAPRHEPFSSRPGASHAPTEPRDFGSPFSASEPWFEPGPRTETGALGWIFRKAQNNLEYPAELRRHEILGRVRAHLVFAENGAFALPELEVRSPSPYLRVYVHRMLERTFTAEPVPASLRRWNGKLHVDCFVSFLFSESGAAVTVDLPDSVVGRRIFLSRKFVKSKTEWELGPLHGMLPVPAVGVDLLWFARQAREAVHPSLPVDDLAPYREDPLFRGN